MQRTLVLVLAGIAATCLVANVRAQRHPHFDDGGALAWHTKLAAAKAAAKKAEKLVFVEYGRAA
jgi:hypothetical protein